MSPSSAATVRPDGSRRSKRRSSMETTSILPSGNQPSPEGCCGTLMTVSTLPSAVTVITRCMNMSENHSLPSCQRGDSGKASPSSSTLALYVEGILDLTMEDVGCSLGIVAILRHLNPETLFPHGLRGHSCINK